MNNSCYNTMQQRLCTNLLVGATSGPAKMIQTAHFFKKTFSWILVKHHLSLHLNRFGSTFFLLYLIWGPPPRQLERGLVSGTIDLLLFISWKETKINKHVFLRANCTISQKGQAIWDGRSIYFRSVLGTYIAGSRTLSSADQVFEKKVRLGEPLIFSWLQVSQRQGEHVVVLGCWKHRTYAMPCPLEPVQMHRSTSSGMASTRLRLPTSS